jgi:hypothetical protein
VPGSAFGDSMSGTGIRKRRPASTSLAHLHDATRSKIRLDKQLPFVSCYEPSLFASTYFLSKNMPTVGQLHAAVAERSVPSALLIRLNWLAPKFALFLFVACPNAHRPPYSVALGGHGLPPCSLRFWPSTSSQKFSRQAVGLEFMAFLGRIGCPEPVSLHSGQPPDLRSSPTCISYGMLNLEVPRVPATMIPLNSSCLITCRYGLRSRTIRKWFLLPITPPPGSQTQMQIHTNCSCPKYFHKHWTIS